MYKVEETLKDDRWRWKKQSLRAGVADDQAGRLTQDLIILLLKFQISRLAEWLITQGYKNCLEEKKVKINVFAHFCFVKIFTPTCVRTG